MAFMMWERPSPRSLGPDPIGKNTLVAITTWSRGAYCRSARPVISSLIPQQYSSAVSKKLTPRSNARLKNGLHSRSSRTQRRLDRMPKEKQPRLRRLTLRPTRPRLTYCMVHNEKTGAPGRTRTCDILLRSQITLPEQHLHRFRFSFIFNSLNTNRFRCTLVTFRCTLVTYW
jgi:hypothetical protein